MENEKLITEFLEFQCKHWKHLSIKKDGNTWYVKMQKKSWKVAPAIIRVVMNDGITIDDYSSKYKFSEFKEFKNTFVDILKNKVESLSSLKI